jgi:putative heme iron utilization protein
MIRVESEKAGFCHGYGNLVISTNIAQYIFKQFAVKHITLVIQKFHGLSLQSRSLIYNIFSTYEKT